MRLFLAVPCAALILLACPTPQASSVSAAEGRPSAAPTPKETPAMTTHCKLLVTRTGERYSLAFELTNGGESALRWTWMSPLTDFRLQARSAGGDPIELDQPALDIPVQPRVLELAPGATERLVSPIQLRFEPAEGPPGEDPFLWTVRHGATGVRLSAQLNLRGPALPACDASVESQ